MLNKLFFSVTRESSLTNELSLTALRVFAGLAMAFGHGSGKVPPSEKFIEGVAGIGFYPPEVFAWLAGLAEFGGGLCLAAGFATRPAAFSIFFTMIIAAFVRHSADPFRVKELALLYLFVTIVFAIRGAGRWSIDRFINRN